MIGRLTSAIPSRPVSSTDRERFRQRFPFGDGMEDLPRGLRKRAERILHELTFPETWPAFDDLAYDAAGRLWVRRPREFGAVRVGWDVFDRDLVYLGVIPLPAGELLARIGEHRIYTIARDSLGVSLVKVYDIK